MKKLFLIAALAITSAAATYAQSGSSRPLEKKIRFGFKLDAGSATLSPKENFIKGDGSKFYFSYGFLADFMLTDNYTIATGLNITHAGGGLTINNEHGLLDNPLVDSTKANSYSIGLQYLEIPFALKLKTDDIKGIRYWGQFGTYLGFNIGKRFSGVVDSKPYEKEGDARITPINMGLDIGAGIEYPFGTKTYGSFGLGYHNGFIDVTKNGSWNDGKVNLNAFFLRTAIYF